MGGNFKFQVQDSFFGTLFWEIRRFEKRIGPSEKKLPLSKPKHHKASKFIPE